MLKPTDKQFVVEIPKIGQFVFRYPTLKDELDIDTTAATILSDNPKPSIGAQNIAMMAATIEIMATSTPDDYRIDNIFSYEDLEKVYSEYLNMVLQFRKQPKTDRSD
jgi:hypothetical protein